MILLFSFNAHWEVKWHQTIEIHHDVVDVAVLKDGLGFMYSTDVFYEAGTTTSVLRDDRIPSREYVGVYYFTQISGSRKQPSALSRLVAAMDQSAKTLIFSGDTNERPFYRLESLRKRGQEE